MHPSILHAPVISPTALLDVGCGTAIITNHLSALHPNARHIYGIDLSPVPYPEKRGKNVEFIQGDFRNLVGVDPRLSPGSRDFVFHRLLICGITDWPGYVRDVFSLLKPGGWAEMQDAAYVWYSDGKVCSEDWAWLNALREGAKRKDMDLECGRNIKRYMEEAGFVDVGVIQYRFPWCTENAGLLGDDWRPEATKISAHAVGNWWKVWWHLVPRMMEGLQYGDKDIEALRKDLKQCTKGELGKEIIFYVTVGRKPTAK